MDFSNPVDLLFTFQGRINRGRYWSAVIIVLLVSIAFTLASFVIAFLGTLGGILILILSVAVYIGVSIAGIAVSIKRLHDRDKSGWWIVLFMFGPSALIGIGLLLDLSTVLSFAAAVIFVWMIVELGFLRGTPGPNQYGPEPV